MIPNFTIGDKTISAYLIMTIIGIFAAGAFSMSRIKNEEEKLEFLVSMLWASVGLLIGGHLLFAITNTDKIMNHILNSDSIITILSYFSGNVFYGGLIGGYIGFIIYHKIKKADYKKYLDEAALFIPLFHTFGRVGCFLSGCCYGVESKIGFVYRYSLIEEANGVCRFPVQLVEAAGNLLIFFLLNHLFKRQLLKQRLIYLYFVIYPILRFILEFFRGDFYRGFLFSLSTSQIISILLFIYGLIMLIISNKKTLHSN